MHPTIREMGQAGFLKTVFCASQCSLADVFVTSELSAAALVGRILRAVLVAPLRGTIERVSAVPVARRTGDELLVIGFFPLRRDGVVFQNLLRGTVYCTPLSYQFDDLRITGHGKLSGITVRYLRICRH